jgi:hypothetical protein
MRSSRLLIGATVLVALLAASTTQAQLSVDKNRSYFSPDGQFGFGVNNAGMHIQYAIGPAFHVGVNLALDFYKDSAHSATFYDFGPYVKFLFSGDVIKPYAYAALGLVQPSTGKVLFEKATGTTTVDLPKAETRIYLAIGGEHFFNQNVGVYGHVNLVDAKLSPSPSTTDFGLQGAKAGIEFFF